MPIIILFVMVLILCFIENIMVQQYTKKLTGTYIAQRFDILILIIMIKAMKGTTKRMKIII